MRLPNKEKKLIEESRVYIIDPEVTGNLFLADLTSSSTLKNRDIYMDITKGGMPFRAAIRQDDETLDTYMDIVPVGKENPPHIIIPSCSPYDLPSVEALQDKIENSINHLFVTGRLDANELKPYEYLQPNANFFERLYDTVSDYIEHPNPAHDGRVLASCQSDSIYIDFVYHNDSHRNGLEVNFLKDNKPECIDAGFLFPADSLDYCCNGEEFRQLLECQLTAASRREGNILAPDVCLSLKSPVKKERVEQATPFVKDCVQHIFDELEQKYNLTGEDTVKLIRHAATEVQKQTTIKNKAITH